MSTLNFTILDVDFPAGSKNKTVGTAADDAALTEAVVSRYPTTAR
jgi:hypothetical protein